jgi:uncharacterized membrane protein YedE/YeeE
VRRLVFAVAAGLLFGLGLVLSGMTQPEKVIGFLDVTGAWDPSLALVMGGALLVHAPVYRLIRRRTSPLFEIAFTVPTRNDLDSSLFAGAALFGAGWGLGGYCPGPAVVSASGGATQAALFTAAMLAGMALQHWTAQRRSAPRQGGDPLLASASTPRPT